MTRFWTAAIQLFAVVCLLVLQAPRPCMGDGAGHACVAATCACVQACTCKAAHAAEREAAGRSPHRACGVLPEDAHDAMLAACHTAEDPHFALPAPGMLLFPAAPAAAWAGAHGDAGAGRAAIAAPSRAPPRPDAPPWKLA